MPVTGRPSSLRAFPDGRRSIAAGNALEGCFGLGHVARTHEAQKIVAGDQVHREEEAIRLLVELVQADQVWVPHLAKNAELALEIGTRLDVPVAKHLERHRPTGCSVEDLVDDAHAALAEGANDLEASAVEGLGAFLAHEGPGVRRILTQKQNERERAGFLKSGCSELLTTGAAWGGPNVRPWA